MSIFIKKGIHMAKLDLITNILKPTIFVQENVFICIEYLHTKNKKLNAIVILITYSSIL